MNNTLVFSILLVFLFFTPFSSYAQETIKGQASYYANEFEGRKTASGEIYSHNNLTCAHRTLPFGTTLKVTNIKNNKSVVVVVNDRGPFSPARIIDLSKSAAEKLDMLKSGIIEVTIEIIKDEKILANKAKNDSILNKSKVETEVKNGPFSTTSLNVKKDTTLQIAKSTSSFFEIIKVNPSPLGMGIKLATFTESKGLMEKVSEIKQKYGQPVFIQSVETQTGDRAYRLFLGRFNTKEEAGFMRLKLLAEFPDCYIITYKNFE